ncbi:MAG: glycosyltransferase, partial [Ilumatobacteraceae bacterium]
MSETEWPSVSVIVPVLNEEEHLQRAVHSILGQNYAGTLDVCLALGPSTDHTDRIAQQIARSSPRVSVVPNPTGGRSSGLNAA